MGVGLPTEERMLKRLQLCLEELFANSIHHGYRGESDVPIRLKLDRSPERVRLTHADWAPAFNLLHVARLPADSERRGVGLNLIRALTNRIQYQHQRAGTSPRWNLPLSAKPRNRCYPIEYIHSLIPDKAAQALHSAAPPLFWRQIPSATTSNNSCPSR